MGLLSASGGSVHQVQFVAMLADMAEGRPWRIEVGVTPIMLLLHNGEVRAFTAECPHAKAPLDEGAICNGRVVCPWHKSVFSLDDGAVLEPPALDRLARYPVRVENGAVMVGADPIATPSGLQVADARTMLVVGGGAAGAAAVSALREFGFAGRVVLAMAEAGTPYDRTALSKFVMAGGMAPDAVPAVRDAGWLDAQRIELRRSAVARLDHAARRAWFADGGSLDYDAALLATGGTPRRLDVAGAQLDCVHTLRSVADAAAIVAGLQKTGPHEAIRVVILGSSFIGLEVASALRDRDVAVTVVSPEDVPFARQFGPRIGAMFRRLHERHGVAFRTGQASRLAGDGRVQAVIVGQEVLPAELVIAGIGVQPATGFVEGVERHDDGGISVDAGMRAADGLYAAGDIAAFPWHGKPTRIEHWRVAQQHARIAARNMLGGQQRYAGVPFFWTYHYGQRFEYFGHAEHWEQVVIDGDLDAGRFVALLVQDNQVAAVVACGRERETAALIERLRAPLPLDEATRMLAS